MTESSSEPRGRPRVGELIAESVRVAASQRVASGVTLLLIAAVCAVILATTGRAVQGEDGVLARIDDAGTRAVVVSDASSGSAGIPVEAVERISRLSSVEWVVGIGFARDGRNAAIGRAGTPVPVRVLYGEPPSTVLRTTSLRPLAAGDAVAGLAASSALGLADGVGGIELEDGTGVAVVGSVQADPPLQFLNEGVVIARAGGGATLRSIHVLARRSDQVGALAEAVTALLGAKDDTAVRIQTSATLAAVRAAVSGELGRFSRRLVLLVLGAGLVLLALNVYGGVMLRRRDFGRRRALGASRSAIVLLILLHTETVAALGAALGSTIGVLLVWRWTGVMPHAAFVVAITTLSLLCAGLAALPPAAFAARRDPIRALPVP